MPKHNQTSFSVGELVTLLNLQQQTLERIKSVENRLEKVESVVTTSFQELKKVIDERAQRSFTLKDSGYEVFHKII